MNGKKGGRSRVTLRARNFSFSLVSCIVCLCLPFVANERSASRGNRGKFAQERADHCGPRERKKKVKTSWEHCWLRHRRAIPPNLPSVPSALLFFRHGADEASCIISKFMAPAAPGPCARYTVPSSFFSSAPSVCFLPSSVRSSLQVALPFEAFRSNIVRRYNVFFFFFLNK